MKFLASIFFLLTFITAASQDNQMYPCKTPCNIGVQIGNYKSGDSIPIHALLNAGGIQAEARQFTVLSYRITIEGVGFSCDGPVEINNPGDKYSEKTVMQLKKLRRGFFIAIECITAKDANGYIIGLKPSVYIVK